MHISTNDGGGKVCKGWMVGRSMHDVEVEGAAMMLLARKGDIGMVREWNGRF